MQIIGFNFERIVAERKKELKGKIEIKTDINISDVSKEQIEVIKDQDVLKFSFSFAVRYEPEFAEINFKGFILLILEKNKIKEILKQWKKKKIPEDIRLPLFNLIMTKSNLKALQLEEELNLPTHVPMPRIKQEQKTNYTG